MPASMTAGDLVNLLKRLNPNLEFVVGTRQQVGIYCAGAHIGGMTSTGTLPPRTILDSNLVIETRGWMDVIAGLYGAGFLPRLHPTLVRLMGVAALDLVSRTGSLPLEGVGDVPAVPVRLTAPERHAWLGRAPDHAA